jgi:hypothetical protein
VRRRDDDRDRRAAMVIHDLDTALGSLQNAQAGHLAGMRELLNELERRFAELEGDR